MGASSVDAVGVVVGVVVDVVVTLTTMIQWLSSH